MKNFYDILGIQENATEDEIKAAYKRLAKQYHPDRHAGNKAYEEKFKEISEAYETLSHPKKRQEYDRMRRFGHGDYYTNAENFSMHFDLNDLFSRFGFAGQRRASGDRFSSFFHSWDDIFENGTADGSPADVYADLKISFRQAVSGGPVEFEYRNSRPSKTLRVQIPEGIEDGGKIRLRGMGSVSGGKAGDLILTVHVEPDPVFQRKGLDVYRDIRLNLAQMILGSTIRVRTVYDELVDIRIPAGTQPGTVLKASGLGIRSGNRRGDFFIKAIPEFPKSLNKKQKELFETFARSCQMEW